MNASKNERLTSCSANIRTHWLLILASACVICCIALGVHDFMLTRLRIPYPNASAVPTWAKYLDVTIRIVSLTWLACIARPTVGRMTYVKEAMLLGLTLMSLHETLRVFLIDIVLTNGWRHSQWLFVLVDSIPSAVLWVFYGAWAALIARLLRHSTLTKVFRVMIAVGAAAAAVAGGMFVLKPWLQVLALHIQSAFHLPDPVQIYFEPYPAHVNWIIYGTFIEATCAALILILLVWPGLTGSVFRKICQCSVFLLLIRGRFVSSLLFSFWLPGSRHLAFLSESQFFLETLLLGMLWGIVVARIDHHDAPSPKR